jgi:hypothetical protein
MPTKAELEALVEHFMKDAKTAGAKVKSAKATRKRTPRAEIPVANLTVGISMERRPQSAEWSVDHALLRFHDAEDKPLRGRLSAEDTMGHELRKEIVAYAKAHRVGKAKIRFDVDLGAWKGRADMFPPRLLALAQYEIKTY